MAIHSGKPASPPTGFTLLEVLIAVVVFSIGLLGLASLQAASLNYHSNSYLRMIAVLEANDIADRMRANIAGVAAGHYDAPSSSGSYYFACLGKDDFGIEDSSKSCSAALLAVHDIYEWNIKVSNNLPNGAGTICLDSTPQDGTAISPACDGLGTLYASKVWWDEREAGPANHADLSTHRLVITFEP